jgi:predicted dehydrogenase
MNLGGHVVSDAIALPPKTDYGIGLIGCGGIVNYGHLPAYRARGFRVLACYDQNRQAAEETAARFGIPRVADSLEDLLADDEIEIVDLAITPWAQREVAEKAANAGKHLLCQKPLSDDYRRAVEIVEIAEQPGVKLAVNQQMRWTAGISVAKQLVDLGAIGTPADIRIETSVRTPWHMWPWIGEGERIDILFHSIHDQDSLRYLFGDPVSVFSQHSRFPDQPETGETRTITLFQYDRPLTTLIDMQHHNWSNDQFSIFRFLGDKGLIRGTKGALYDYPNGRVDTLAFQANAEPLVWHEASLSTRWFPDAFAGPMASLMEAIQTGGEPITSGRDNLKTLQTVFAAYRSAAENRPVTLAEIAASAA